MTPPADVRIHPATERDAATILGLIRGLADYTQFSHAVTATEADIRDSLFGEWPAAEVVLAQVGADVVGFALFFHNYSTFLARRGMYLEDLFVVPAWRGMGIGRRLLSHLARMAIDRRCARLEWAVLDWNESAVRFYRSLGAVALDEQTVYRLTGDALARVADL